MSIQRTGSLLRRSRGRNRLARGVAWLAGCGLLASSCEMRLRDGLVDGSKQFVLEFLDPTNYTDLIEGVTEDITDEAP